MMEISKIARKHQLMRWTFVYNDTNTLNAHLPSPVDT